jgi:hypothetical protein
MFGARRRHWRSSVGVSYRHRGLNRMSRVSDTMTSLHLRPSGTNGKVRGIGCVPDEHGLVVATLAILSSAIALWFLIVLLLWATFARHG